MQVAVPRIAIDECFAQIEVKGCVKPKYTHTPKAIVDGWI